MYCWEWVRGKNGVGYGIIYHNKKTILAHRISYEIHIGKIPEGRIICHHCDNPGCVNPAHLYAGTYQDNVNDMMKRRRHKSQKDLDKLLNSYFEY
jgi:Fe-S-cluster-containing dehydrogenase component